MHILVYVSYFFKSYYIILYHSYRNPPQTSILFNNSESKLYHHAYTQYTLGFCLTAAINCPMDKQLLAVHVIYPNYVKLVTTEPVTLHLSNNNKFNSHLYGASLIWYPGDNGALKSCVGIYMEKSYACYKGWVFLCVVIYEWICG